MKDLSTQNAKTQALNNTLPSKEVAGLHSCIVEMRNEIASLKADAVSFKTMIVDQQREITSLKEREISLDKGWNKTIDELERLKQMPEVHKAIYGIK